MTHGLVLAGVDARHDEDPVLEGIDLAVPAGEVLTVVGPSGSGKTTLLRCVAGLHPVASGSVTLAGRDVTDLDPGRRRVAMVFQQGGLFPHLDVAANIGFGLAVRKVPRGEAGDRVRWAAELVGVGDLLARRPDQLSGGERQRVALARALAGRPDALLLDEPLSSLDARLRDQLRTELLLLRRRVPVTTVHVTHDQVEALTLGDRVAVLDGGRLRQVGPPGELWARPANRFVATFLGTPAMNVLPAPAAHGRYRVGPLHVPCEQVPGAPPIVELGARPDAVRLVPPSAPGATPGTVVVSEVTGPESWVHVACEAGTLVAATGPVAPPTPGTTVGLVVDPERCFVFSDTPEGTTLRWARIDGRADR